MKAICLLVASALLALLTAQPAFATSPPCDYDVGETMIDYDGSATCLEVQLSACYIGIEGQVTNNCNESIELLQWPLRPDQPSVLGNGDVAYFTISAEETPVDAMYDVMAGPDDPGFVHIVAALERVETTPVNGQRIDGGGLYEDDDDGCSTVGLASPSGGGAVGAMLLVALAVVLRRRSY